MTFFSKVKFRFQPVKDDQKIEIVPFLHACAEIVPFFDILGPTAFAPIKSKVNGNLQKLTKIHGENPEKFVTLQDTVQSEIDAGTTKAKNSATDAILWIKRSRFGSSNLFQCSLSFSLTKHCLVFLQEVLTGEQDLTKCSKSAHEKTLKKYQPWMVQNIFSIAMKSVPYRKDFIQKLGDGEEESVVLKDMEEYVDEFRSTMHAITEFCHKNGLEEA